MVTHSMMTHWQVVHSKTRMETANLFDVRTTPTTWAATEAFGAQPKEMRWKRLTSKHYNEPMTGESDAK